MSTNFIVVVTFNTNPENHTAARTQIDDYIRTFSANNPALLRVDCTSFKQEQVCCTTQVGNQKMISSRSRLRQKITLHYLPFGNTPQVPTSIIFLRNTEIQQR